MSLFSKAYFHDEAAAFAKLESIVWPQGPVCPHCGNEVQPILNEQEKEALAAKGGSAETGSDDYITPIN